MQNSRANIPWNERAYVTVPEAAQILGRSPIWVRRRIWGEQLKAVRMMRGGPLAVSIPSILSYLDTLQPVEPTEAEPGRPRLTIVRNDA